MRRTGDLAKKLEVYGLGGQCCTPLMKYRLRARDWTLMVDTVLAAIAIGSRLLVISP